MNIKNMPKVELHLHLDGSVRKSTLKELYDCSDNDIEVDDNCRNLNDYLSKFEIPIKVMQTKENLERIAYELVEDLTLENVIYAEIRFAPMLHTKKISADEVVESVLKGLQKGKIKTNLILCCIRGASVEQNTETVILAKKYNCAIDLAGAEGIYPTEHYKYIFDLCKDLNIKYTIHAGEALGYDSINQALLYGTKRIGHGINYERDQMIEKYIEKNITLEICPTSNIQTKAINKIENHPIYKLYKRNVKVTINTDNRTVSNTTLTKEYERILYTFNLNIKDLIQMNINAINGSFLNEDEKKYLIQKYYGENNENRNI